MCLRILHATSILSKRFELNWEMMRDIVLAPVIRCRRAFIATSNFILFSVRFRILAQSTKFSANSLLRSSCFTNGEKEMRECMRYLKRLRTLFILRTIKFTIFYERRISVWYTLHRPRTRIENRVKSASQSPYNFYIYP